MAELPEPLLDDAASPSPSPPSFSSLSLFFVHVRLLLWKNFSLKRRQRTPTALEILIPILLCLAFCWIRSELDIESLPARYNVESGLALDLIDPGVGQLAVATVCGCAARRTLPIEGYRANFGQIALLPHSSTVPPSSPSYVNSSEISLMAFVLREALTGVAQQSRQTPFIRCRCGDRRYINVVNYIQTRLFREFPSESSLSSYLASPDYASDDKPPIAAAVIFHQFQPKTAQFHYKISMNSSDVPSHLSVYDPFATLFNATWARYYVSGYLQLANIVDKFLILRAAVENPTPLALALNLGGLSLDRNATRGGLGAGLRGLLQYGSTVISPFPEPAGFDDEFSFYMQNLVGLLLTLIFIFPFTRHVRHLVEEKEKRLHESMMLIGCSNSAYWISWALSYLAIYFILILIICYCFQRPTVFEAASPLLFPLTSFGVLFAFLFLIALNLVALASLCSTFFQTARTSAILSPFLLLLLYLPYWAVQYDHLHYGYCLFPPVALTLTLVKLIQLEAAMVGTTWSNVTDASYAFRVSSGLNYLLLDFFLISLLAYYCEQILTKPSGAPGKPLYFPLQPDTWRPAIAWCKHAWTWCRAKWLGGAVYADASADGDDGEARAFVKEPLPPLPEGGELFESVDPATAPAPTIRIRGLTKEFPLSRGINFPYLSQLVRGRVAWADFSWRSLVRHERLVAVSNLSLDIYPDSIFVLLGRNGGGKSTTFNLLSGALAATSGRAELLGYDLTKEIGTLRHSQSLSVCPQQNILFDSLTVYEHLVFFGSLKRLSGRALDDAARTAMKEVDLEEKANTQAHALSGGMKRRLSLAIALIGDPAIVLCDEFSAGVDARSRRRLWSLIKAKKKGRCIILTTHEMEEGDQLADRVGILAMGRLQCVGTTQFLKAKLGFGYNLTVGRAVKPLASQPAASPPSAASVAPLHDGVPSSSIDYFSRWSVPAIDSFLSGHVSAAERHVTTNNELTYRIPAHAAAKFPALLAALEDSCLAAYGIAHYSLSSTTLEEVFRQVARGGERGQQEEHRQQGQDEDARVSLAVSDGRAADDSLSSSLLSGGESNDNDIQMSEFSALPANEEAAHHDSGNSDANVSPTSSTDPSELSFLFPSSAPLPLFAHFRALLLKRAHSSKRDTRAFTCAFIIPILLLVTGLSLLQIPPDYTFPLLHMNPTQLDKHAPAYLFAPPRLPLPLSEGFRGIQMDNGEPVLLERDDSADYFPARLLDARLNHSHSHFSAFCSLSSVPRVFPLLTVGFNGLVNVTAIHGQPITLNLGNAALLRSLTNRSAARLAMDSQPFAWTAQQRASVNNINSIFASIMVSLAFSFIPAAFVVAFVDERETGAKHMQTISGVNRLSYYFAAYVWDYGVFLASASICTIIIYSYGNPNYNGPNLPVLLASMSLFGLAIIPFTYLLSFLFRSPSSAQNFMILIYLITGLVLTLTAFGLYVNKKTRALHDDILRPLFRLFPGFCLADSVLYLSIRQSGFSSASKWALKVSGWDLIAMALEAPVYFMLVMAVEYYTTTGPGPWNWRRIAHRGFEAVKQFAQRALTNDRAAASLSQPLAHSPASSDSADGGGGASDGHEDADVFAERVRVSSGAAEAAGDSLIVDGLRVVYPPNKVAVSDLSFAIPRGEVFSLLGVNGCGKSSTMKAITGDLFSASGRILINGLDRQNFPDKVRKYIGYCGQFEALFPHMSPTETLHFYGRIRGLDESALKPMCEYLMTRLGLVAYADRPVRTLSGGNKRRVSVAVSLVGSPSILCLDEATASIDPEGRTVILNFLSATNRADRATLMTSHFMNDSEAVSNRIAIMKAGELQCVGSVSRIKHLFGKAYELFIKVAHGRSLAQARQFLERRLSGLRLLEEDESTAKFTLPIDSGASGHRVRMGEIFALFEAAREPLGLAEYSVGQSTLDQIFIRLAKDETIEEETEEQQEEEKQSN